MAFKGWRPDDPLPSSVGELRALTLKLLQDIDMHKAAHKFSDMNFSNLAQHHPIRVLGLPQPPTPPGDIYTFIGSGILTIPVPTILENSIIGCCIASTVPNITSGFVTGVASAETIDSAGTPLLAFKNNFGDGGEYYNLSVKMVGVTPATAALKFTITGPTDQLTSILVSPPMPKSISAGILTAAAGQFDFNNTGVTGTYTKDWSTTVYYDPLGGVVGGMIGYAFPDGAFPGPYGIAGIDAGASASTINDVASGGLPIYTLDAAVGGPGVDKIPAAIGFVASGGVITFNGTPDIAVPPNILGYKGEFSSFMDSGPP